MYKCESLLFVLAILSGLLITPLRHASALELTPAMKDAIAPSPQLSESHSLILPNSSMTGTVEN